MSIKRALFCPGKIFHVYNHANAKDNLFLETVNYEKFLEKYSFYISPIADTFAFSLLPNHFHFLLKIKEEHNLINEYKLIYPKKSINLIKKTMNKCNSQQFGNFLNSYSTYFNIKYERRGSLFLHSIERKKIQTPDYFINAFNYIQFNPVKHRLVDNVEDYSYTSYHAYNSEKISKIPVCVKLAFKLFPDLKNNKNKIIDKELKKYALDLKLFY